MTPIEAKYRDTVNRLAFALLIFEVLFLLFGVVIGIIPLFTGKLAKREANIIYEIVYGLIYALVFVAPVFFFRCFSRGKESEPMLLERKLPRETVPYIFIGLAVIIAAAYVNSFIVSAFGQSSFSEEMLWGQDVSANYQVILMLFTVAVVPAFVEEFLFRGLILSNLLPYGRTTAIFASALLFGVMHQNVEQLLYATVAGLVLGYLYVKTRSIWVCVLLHFVNNFHSVLQTVLLQRLSEMVANAVIGALQGVIFAVGLLSAILLLLRQPDRRAELLKTGTFELDLPADPEYVAEEIPLKRRVRLFFSIPMIAFFVACVIQMGAMILLAALVL
ncbi:MAG: CPBP family intramembrane metalloprotease [Clostridia bacterium]|nr:CPBP family intramembrane metalloprotease [Clostridia bacterium]